MTTMTDKKLRHIADGTTSGMSLCDADIQELAELALKWNDRARKFAKQRNDSRDQNSALVHALHIANEFVSMVSAYDEKERAIEIERVSNVIVSALRKVKP